VVGVVVGEATAAFVHAGDVDVAVARQVTGDLHVANEGRLGAHHGCAAPSGTVISRAGNEDVRVGKTKVVPGNVHISEERRGRVVVGPSRFAVVAAVVVNAEVRPAIWILRSQGLVSAEGAAPIPIYPDSKPRLAWLVVQKNRVAKGVGERATTAAVGEAGEGHAAVGGERCCGEVVGGCAS